jgi:hypothetical protein
MKREKESSPCLMHDEKEKRKELKREDKAR